MVVIISVAASVVLIAIILAAVIRIRVVRGRRRGEADRSPLRESGGVAGASSAVLVTQIKETAHGQTTHDCDEKDPDVIPPHVAGKVELNSQSF